MLASHDPKKQLYHLIAIHRGYGSGAASCRWVTARAVGATFLAFIFFPITTENSLP
jgi:hypothetical protein